MTRRTLAAALLAATALATPAAAFDLENMTEDERAAFGAQIRSYLLENPEVLMEAIGVLERREAEAQVAADRDMARANRDALWNDGHSLVSGNPDGDITIVEFIDYRCGYCRRAYPEVQELIATDGNIRLITKEFPILGEGSTLSSQFAIAVKEIHGDDAYKDAHDALIALRADATRETLEDLAEGLGLDADAILVEMSSPHVAEVIAENRALAERLQISGTPTFVFEDQMVRGYLPIGQMRGVVQELREEQG